MKIPKLNKIKVSDTIACIDIADLVEAGLSKNEDFEISKQFCREYQCNHDDLFHLHVCRSNGWYGNIEIHFAFMFDDPDRDENTHISQEVFVTMDDEDRYKFLCPALGGYVMCDRIYLRQDDPLFASKKALNIE